jgi:hypothetical protein
MFSTSGLTGASREVARMLGISTVEFQCARKGTEGPFTPTGTPPGSKSTGYHYETDKDSFRNLASNMIAMHWRVLRAQPTAGVMRTVSQALASAPHDLGAPRLLLSGAFDDEIAHHGRSAAPDSLSSIISVLEAARSNPDAAILQAFVTPL